MAACRSIQHIFENPLPENQSLLESLSSWNQKIKQPNIEQSSITEIFGELHFKENSSPVVASNSSFAISPLSSKSMLDLNPEKITIFKPSKIDTFQSNESQQPQIFSGYSQKIMKYKSNYHCSMSCDSFSLNSESLQLCTEGLGSESSDDVEEMKNEMKEDEWKRNEGYSNHTVMKRSRATSVGKFPPPISCIGKSGKPGVCFKSYRQDGRFVLKEVRVPTQEFLHACREDGRLKLQFVQPNDQEEFEEDEEEVLDEIEDIEGGIINDDFDESREIRNT